MLQPKRVKYRKIHRGKLRGRAFNGNTIEFGDFAMQAKEAYLLSARQIEAARRVLVRYLRRGGQMWIRVFPDKPMSKKPAETRMGGGKGDPDQWVAKVRPGRILFEMGGIKEDSSREAIKLAAYKLPIAVKFVAKEADGGMEIES